MSILVPIDLREAALGHPPGDASRCAVELAALICRVLQVKAELFHVTERPPSLNRLALLHAAAEPLREAGVLTRLRTAQGEPAPTISAEAAGRASSWIIMGTRGGTADPKDEGSVSRAVMKLATTRVAAIRPGQVSRHAFPVGLGVVLVSAEAEGPANDLASLLARATRGALSRLRPGTPDGPLFSTGALLHAETPLVLAFDTARPDDQRWCARVLNEEQSRPVVLVSANRCGTGA